MLNIDVNILESLQWMKNPVMDKFMVFFSYLGNGAMIWVIIALLFIVRKKYRLFGVFILIGLGVGFLVGNVFLKNIIARPRPSWNNDDIILLITNPSDYSFPSGHTMHSFIVAMMLTLKNWKWGIPAFFLAIAISFSRLYLYVHYPTDVFAGAIIGVFIGTIMAVFYRKWEEKTDGI